MSNARQFQQVLFAALCYKLKVRKCLQLEQACIGFNPGRCAVTSMKLTPHYRYSRGKHNMHAKGEDGNNSERFMQISIHPHVDPGLITTLLVWASARRFVRSQCADSFAWFLAAYLARYSSACASFAYRKAATTTRLGVGALVLPRNGRHLVARFHF